MVKLLTLTLLLAGGIAALPAGGANAQQSVEQDIFAPVGDPNAAAPDQGAKPVKKPKPLVAAQKPAAAIPAATGGGDVEQRLQQLEEQIADMQVVVGTMESTGKGRPAGSAPIAGGAAGDLDVRVGRLEAQMQGLSSQMTQLADQIRLLRGRSGAGNDNSNFEGSLKPGAPPEAKPTAVGKQGGLDGMLSEEPAAADTGFGQTTISQGGLEPPAPLATAASGINQGAPLDPATPARQPAATQPRLQPAAPQVAALAPPSNDPQTAYDQAYGLVLQQDYSGAEAAFRDYVTRFAQSPLASNANYWLGQSYYARGQYKPAADAFLKGYKSYRTGQKAPDSLLKVAMSLSRLGQKDMACSAFTALDGEFPNASVQVKHLAQAERERAGC